MVLIQHRHNIIQNNGYIPAQTQHRTEQWLYSSTDTTSYRTMVLLQHKHNIVQNNGSITAQTQHRTEQWF